MAFCFVPGAQGRRELERRLLCSAVKTVPQSIRFDPIRYEKKRSTLTHGTALIHNYPCNLHHSFYHPLALIPIIPSRTVSTLLSLGISLLY